MITFLTSGAAVALLDVVKAYLSRDESLTITIQRNDGTTATLDAKNIDEAERLARELLVPPAAGQPVQ